MSHRSRKRCGTQKLMGSDRAGHVTRVRNTVNIHMGCTARCRKTPALASYTLFGTRNVCAEFRTVDLRLAACTFPHVPTEWGKRNPDCGRISYRFKRMPSIRYLLGASVNFHHTRQNVQCEMGEMEPIFKCVSGVLLVGVIGLLFAGVDF